MPRLWAEIDTTHVAIQRLHRLFSKLQRAAAHHTHAEIEYAHDHSLEFDVLIAVRMDTRILDIVNLCHTFLCRQLGAALPAAIRAQLQDLVALSDRRVRKCLKLLSYYAHVFTESRDKQ